MYAKIYVMLIVYRYCVDIVRMLRAVLLLTVLLAWSPPCSAWYPYYRPFPFVRRPARPHNPIIVQADRVKVDNSRRLACYSDTAH